RSSGPGKASSRRRRNDPPTLEPLPWSRFGGGLGLVLGSWFGPGALGSRRRERRWAGGFLANPVAPNVADQAQAGAQAGGTGSGDRQGEHSNPQGRTFLACRRSVRRGARAQCRI